MSADQGNDLKEIDLSFTFWKAVHDITFCSMFRSKWNISIATDPFLHERYLLIHLLFLFSEDVIMGNGSEYRILGVDSCGQCMPPKHVTWLSAGTCAQDESVIGSAFHLIENLETIR